MSFEATHVSHCCRKHGCKYARGEACPVESGRLKQEHPCEDCHSQGIHSVEQLYRVLTGEQRVCLDCGHLLPEMPRTAAPGEAVLIDKIRFTPVDADSPRNRAAKSLASYLYRQGVKDIFALSTAVRVFAGIQRALDANDLEEASKEWDGE